MEEVSSADTMSIVDFRPHFFLVKIMVIFWLNIWRCGKVAVGTFHKRIFVSNIFNSFSNFVFFVTVLFVWTVN